MQAGHLASPWRPSLAEGQMEEGTPTHFTGSCVPWPESARHGRLEAGPGLGTQPGPETLSRSRQGPARPSGRRGSWPLLCQAGGCWGCLGPDLWPPLPNRKAHPFSLCPGEGSLYAQGHRKRAPGGGDLDSPGGQTRGLWGDGCNPHVPMVGGGAWCLGAAQRCLGDS